jgi:hypothetical protein
VSRRHPVVLIALASLALAGCSEEHSITTLPPGSSAPAASTAAAPTTTAAAPTAEPSTGTRKSPIRWLGPAATGPAAAVQEATRGYWSMVVRLAEKPDPDDPAIAALSVDPQRADLVTLFTGIRQQGLSQRGPVDGTATVASVTGAAAVVRTCLDQTLTKVYDKAGKPRAGSAGTLTLFTVSLREAEGAWQVAGVTGKDNACRTR